MAKKKSPHTAPKKIAVLKIPVKNYADDTQSRVEHYYANGFDAWAIRDKLQLELDEVRSRLKQVEREYSILVDHMEKPDYVKLERAKLVKRSQIRRDDLLAYVETQLAWMKKSKKLVDYPDKALANLRAEDQWMNKMLTELGKSGAASKATEDATKEFLGKMMEDVAPDPVEVDDESEEAVVSKDLMDDLNTAVQDEFFK